LEFDRLKGPDWSWLSMDGCQTKAPLWEKNGKNPTDRGKLGTKRSPLVEAAGVPVGLAIVGANRYNIKQINLTIESIQVERPTPIATAPQMISIDKG
jgi:putative transposase